jgi:hypothetical protein
MGTIMRKVQKVTNEQFFRICNEIQTHREVLLRECKTKQEVSAWIKQRLDITAGPSSVESVLKTLNIELEKPKREHNTPGAAKNNTRVLANAILHLYKELGQQPPSQLVDLQHRCNRGLDVPTETPVNGVPVNSVPDPRTIPVVSK